LTSAAETIHESVFRAAAANPRGTALLYKSGGRYLAVPYASLVGAVSLAAERLRALGFGRGHIAGILSPNRPQWIVADLAVLALGGIVVPVYPTLPPDPLRYIINDSGMRVLFVGETSLREKVDSIRSETAGLDEVISLNDWGIRFPPAAADARIDRAPAGMEAPGARVTPADASTIVYTSGTTGEPKGVVLTHGNIVSNARALIERYRISSADSAVSYLPLAHLFERTCGHYVFLFAGGTVAYAQGLSTVVEDVGAVRPTVLIAVPRVLERAYEAAAAKIGSGPWIGRGVVRRAFALLNERANRRYQGKSVSPWLRARCRLYDALVASRFRRIGGGRLRLIVSGGAPLDRQLGKILRVLGFGLVEGYGMTETSPVVSCGDVADHRLGTVGKPLPAVEVRISEGGEIRIRGPNVMQGYLNKPEETAAVLDGEGWLRTGDLGEFDELGNLVVTGRSKEIIVTSYGKNVAPAPIEARIARSPYVEQAVVFGDGRKSLVALIVPERAAMERFATQRGIAWDSYDALLELPAIMEVIGGELKRANAELAPYERVASFGLLAEPFSESNGMLTPTLKLRRGSIAETCRERIEALYEGLEEKRAP
jgi:long-chain acyl-CoA synthetase